MRDPVLLVSPWMTLNAHRKASCGAGLAASTARELGFFSRMSCCTKVQNCWEQVIELCTPRALMKTQPAD
jgi:hypothetical protein